MLGRDDIGLLDRAAFNALWFAEHLAGEKLAQRKPVRRAFDATRKLVRERIGRQLRKKGKGRVLPIDERRNLSPEEFSERYLHQARPVVMRGAASDWECTKKWTPQWFADSYGDDRVMIVHLEADWNRDHKVEETRLAEVIKSMGSGVMKYARFVPLFKRHPELFDHFDREFLARYVGRPVKLFGSEGKGVGLRSQLFIGERGTHTSFHNAMTNNLFVQAHGRKHWLIVPPSYNAVINPPIARTPGYFPAYLNPHDPDPDEFWMFEYIDRYELTLNEGDVLYNPPFHWHWVTNPVDSIGIGIRWYYKVSARKSCWTQDRLAFMATNPTMDEYLKDMDDDFGVNFAKAKAI